MPRKKRWLHWVLGPGVGDSELARADPACRRAELRSTDRMGKDDKAGERWDGGRRGHHEETCPLTGKGCGKCTTLRGVGRMAVPGRAHVRTEGQCGEVPGSGFKQGNHISNPEGCREEGVCVCCFFLGGGGC